MTPAPSPNGPDSRDRRGRFSKGNLGGPGNPHAAQVARLRSALLEAVKEADMKAVARRLVKLAREGDVPAIRELLLRTIGKPLEADLIGRIEAIERALCGTGGQHGSEATTGPGRA